MRANSTTTSATLREPRVLSPSAYPTFREFLAEELARRMASNPRYSLRAFARYLNLQSSYLSKVLRGERRVTPNLVRRVSPLLSLSPEVTSHFQAQSTRKKSVEPSPSVRFQLLSLDYFAAISNWYHFALMELIQVPGFRNDPNWIGEQLAISSELATSTLSRLTRLNLIEARDGVLHCVGNFSNAVDPLVISKSQQCLQKEVLGLAITAMDNFPPAERDQSSLTMACPSSLLPEVKERIRKFRRELGNFVETAPAKPDRVFHLSVSLYPVSKVIKSYRELH